jgi:chemotaxis protein methyltransferase CheR
MTFTAAFTDPAMSLLVDLIHSRTGLRFDDNRKVMLLDKLTQLLKEGQFNSITDYYYFLKYDSEADDEWKRLQSVLAVNETYFWREFDQISAAANLIIPHLLHERPQKPVRIWHAACASGEEPFTLAMALNENGGFQNGSIEILATDFNQLALEKARAGIYRQRTFRSIPPDIMARYFKPAGIGQYQISQSIQERVNFKYLNLMDEQSMTSIGSFDLIFCRNVFIYFSDKAMRQVVTWFHQALPPEGYLFTGAAESLLRLTNLYKLVEIGTAFGYQKCQTRGD